MQSAEHLREAEEVEGSCGPVKGAQANLDALKARDPGLKEVLEWDEMENGATKSAFELYRRNRDEHED